ncbi:hypothetical protein MPSI1_000058 [Malassezia psittaci]|uniref:FF domain-containing protein n=1 Tax=Malassezia psittaci TaxID=1821823 RepID=A0AAF0JI69_9BASI|nr:hypothetical protein MPSI1_000058 [Malassezia psittaci]
MESERPCEKVPIPGTDGWMRVTTTHGNVFYAQKKTKRSEWDVPEEIRDQVDAMQGRPMKRAKIAEPHDSRHTQIDTDEDENEDQDLTPAEMFPHEDVEEAASSPLTTAVPSMQTQLSLEEGRALFMNMLTSLNGSPQEVNPMAPWDRELVKFVHLPAYSALPSTRDREDAFNEWCKLRIRENKQRKRRQSESRESNGPDPARELYSLFKHHVVSTRTSFEDVQRKYKSYACFSQLSEQKAREVFDQWMQELQRIKRSLAQKADDAFLRLLSEKLPTPAILRGNAKLEMPTKQQALDMWTTSKKTPGLVEDKRYDAVGSATRRAELFVSYVQSPSDTPTEHHSRTQPDPANRSLDSSHDEAAARQERALRQRQAQVRREQGRLHGQNTAARKDVVLEQRELEFQQLLVDSVRDACIAWEDAQTVLQRDERYKPRDNAQDTLDDASKRRFFDEHLQRLRRKKRDQLAQLFAKHVKDEHGREQLKIDVDTVLAHVRSDDMFQHTSLKRFVGEDAGAHRSLFTTLEREYQAWDRQRHERARAEFFEMLKENAFVDFWGRLQKEKEQHAKDADDIRIAEDDDMDPEEKSIYDMASHVDISEMEAVLRNDRRYRVFAHVPEQRTEWIKSKAKPNLVPGIPTNVAELCTGAFVMHAGGRGIKENRLRPVASPRSVQPALQFAAGAKSGTSSEVGADNRPKNSDVLSIALPSHVFGYGLGSDQTIGS